MKIVLASIGVFWPWLPICKYGFRKKVFSWVAPRVTKEQYRRNLNV